MEKGSHTDTLRPAPTIASVMAKGLTEAEARVVVETVPLRGTADWDFREMLRRRLGCSCLAFTSWVSQ